SRPALLQRIRQRQGRRHAIHCSGLSGWSGDDANATVRSIFFREVNQRPQKNSSKVAEIADFFPGKSTKVSGVGIGWIIEDHPKWHPRTTISIFSLELSS